MLRQRRPRKDECHHDKVSNDESIPRTTSSTTTTTTTTFPPKRSRIGLSWIVSFIIIVGIMVVVWIIHWRREVWIHGKECEMTYSRPNYIPISTTTTTEEGNSFYRLYQFVDWDDRYHRSLLYSSSKKLQFCNNNNNNNNDDWIVLFVPGYGGSYKQVRSLGNHIIHHPNYNDRIKIITLEWIHDGGLIWHADLLQHYVLQLQQLLHSSCCCSSTTTKITIVAHSIGGIVSRMALQRRHPPNHNNHQQTWSNPINLITLATPHVQFPYTYFWDTTHMKHYNFHTTSNNNNNNNNTIISISAGIRDELIPNILTFIHHTTNNNIILVPKLGMDHQAIVWCHSVLHTLVDQYIFNSTTNVVQTKTLEQIQTEALNTHGILSNGLLLITMPYTICYILLNIYPTTILLHHILLPLLFFTKTNTQKTITIMTFLLQSFIQLTLWKYPYYDHLPNNTTTFTIIFTCSMNALVTILYHLHRRALGFICDFFPHNNNNTTTLHRRITWNKSFMILYIICFVPSYYIINWGGGYSTIFIQMICHLWTIWTFQPLLVSSFMRQNDNNHWIVMTLMAFLPMYCIYFIRQCIIYYFFHALNVITTLNKISPSFFVSHMIILLWNQFILTTTTTTSNSYVANYNNNTY